MNRHRLSGPGRPFPRREFQESTVSTPSPSVPRPGSAADLPGARRLARAALTLDDPPPAAEGAELLRLLAERVLLLLPEVRARVERLSEDDAAARVARIGIDEAWRRLHTSPGFGPGAALAHIRRLARSVGSLCDHWENLEYGTPSPHPAGSSPARPRLGLCWSPQPGAPARDCTRADGHGGDHHHESAGVSWAAGDSEARQGR
jgi:hypothetical protein